MSEIIEFKASYSSGWLSIVKKFNLYVYPGSSDRFLARNRLDKPGYVAIITSNNTRHAFRKICAPWRVTCFWGMGN